MYAFDVFANHIITYHNQFRDNIRRQFNIDIDQYLQGGKIVNQITDANNVNGTVYIIFPASDFDINNNDRFNKKLILKLQQGHDDISFFNEYYMQLKFHEVNLAPAVKYHKLIPINDRRVVQIIIMDKTSDNTIINLLTQNLSDEELHQISLWIISLFETMKLNKLIHGDMHTGNIGIEYDESCRPLQLRPVLIDFGQSSINNTGHNKYYRVDLLQFLRSLLCFDKKIPTRVSNYLFNIFYDKYNFEYNRYNPKILPSCVGRNRNPNVSNIIDGYITIHSDYYYHVCNEFTKNDREFINALDRHRRL